MCLQVSTPGSRVRFWGCSLAGLSRTARGLKRLSAMDTLYLMPDGWWEIKDNIKKKLQLKCIKSVSPAHQKSSIPLFFNEGKLFSWCNFCCRLMDYRRLWQVTSLQCNVIFAQHWSYDECATNLCQNPTVSSFPATQTRPVLMAWGTVGYGWTSVQCAWGHHRSCGLLTTNV